MFVRRTGPSHRLWALLAAALGIVLVLPGAAHASVSDDSDFSVKVDGTVLSMAPAEWGRTIIGGTFTKIGSQSRTGLGAVWSSGYADKNFAPVLPAGSVVNAVATSPDQSIVYVGGEFTSINGVPRSNLAVLDAKTGAVIESWQADTNSDVRDIEVAGDRVYVSGTFTNIDGQTKRKRLVALDTAGDVIFSFNPQPSWTVRQVKVTADLSTLYVIGAFETIGGATRSNHLAGLDAATGAATAFDPSLGGGLAIGLGISADGSHVIFSTENNQTIAYQPAVSNNPIWVVKSSGDNQAIAISETGEVYIGGHFKHLTQPDGTRVRTGLAASLWLADGSITSWRPDVIGSMGPWDIMIADSRVQVGGDFSEAGGAKTGGFARFSGTP